jgi:hypothetical protein
MSFTHSPFLRLLSIFFISPLFVSHSLISLPLFLPLFLYFSLL